MNTNKLTNNPKKTQCIVIGTYGTEQRLRNRRNLSIKVDSVVIENVSRAKLLSVLMKYVSFGQNVLMFYFILKKACK